MLPPTSGFIGLSLAINNFKDVSCFGFDFYESKADHYFEDVVKYERKDVHPLNIERSFFEFLIQCI